MKISPRDMMIGNLVTRHEVETLVNENTITNASKEELLGGDGYHGLTITAELLEQLGFEWCDHLIFNSGFRTYSRRAADNVYFVLVDIENLYQKKEMIGHCDFSRAWAGSKVNIAGDLSYAHELQNIWKAVTKETLVKIK